MQDGRENDGCGQNHTITASLWGWYADKTNTLVVKKGTNIKKKKRSRAPQKQPRSKGKENPVLPTKQTQGDRVKHTPQGPSGDRAPPDSDFNFSI